MAAYLQWVLIAGGTAEFSLKGLKTESVEPKETIPLKLQEDTIILSSEIKKEHVTLSDGYEYDKHNQQVDFRLKNSLLNEWIDFVPALWNAYIATQKQKNQQLLNTEKLKKFMNNQFSTMEFSAENLSKIDHQLAKLHHNYYLRYHSGLVERCVYCGWPYASNEKRQLYLGYFTLLYLNNKLGLELDEEYQFRAIFVEVKETLMKDYRLAKHLWIMGF